jgi:hypothetical protein
MPELIVPVFLYVGLNAFRSNRPGQVRAGYLTQPNLIKIFGSGQSNYLTRPDPCGALTINSRLISIGVLVLTLILHKNFY